MSNENSEFDKLFNEALKYFIAGDYALAIECFEKIPPSYEKYNDVLLNLGATYTYKGEHDEAIECFEKVSSDFENYNDVLVILATAYSRKGEYDEAIEYYKQIPKSYEKYNDVLFNLGLAYSRKGEYDEAIEYYKKVSSDFENCNAVLNGLGGAYFNKGDHDEAIECLKKIPDSYKNYHGVLFNLGLAYVKKGDDDKAIECLKKIPKSYANYNAVLLNLGLAYSSKGEHDLAIENYIKYSELNYGFTTIYLIVKFLMDLKASIKTIESILKNDDIWSKDEIFQSIIKKKNGDEIDSFKSIWLYQSIILYVISFKGKEKENEKKEDKYFKIAHYTSYNTLKHLIGFNEKDKTPSSIRMISLSTANDPKEGAVLLNILKDCSINIEPIEDEKNQLIPLQTSFSKNRDSLTMFRLYGKENDKEATGVCLVFNEHFFDTDCTSMPNSFTTESMSSMSFISSRLNSLSMSSHNEKTDSISMSQNDNKKEPPKRSLFHVLYYDADNQELIFNKKETKHGRNIIISLRGLNNIENINDNGTIIELIRYCFANIIKTIGTIKKDENKQICYNLLVNLQYLIKDDAWIEESELRLIRIIDMNTKSEIDYMNDRVYEDYLKIINYDEKYLEEIILGTKIEDNKSKKETLNKFLKQEKNYDACVTTSKAPLK